MAGKVVVAGANGFIGRHLANYLTERGFEVVALVRHPSGNLSVREVLWDGKTVGDWSAELNGAKAVINLCGEPVSQHWSESGKLRILRSRLEPTSAIGQAIQSCESPPAVWINNSAIGYYGNRGDEPLTESSEPGEKGNFMVDTCVAWEAEISRYLRPKTRMAWIRAGIVLGGGGGALKPLVAITKWFLGGQAGNGLQVMSWLHIKDLARLYEWVIEHEISGPINGTSPEPVSNSFFMTALRAVLYRPWCPPAPAFMLRLVALLGGPDPSLLLEGQKVLPKAAMDSGFDFQFKNLRDTLLNVVR